MRSQYRMLEHAEQLNQFCPRVFKVILLFLDVLVFQAAHRIQAAQYEQTVRTHSYASYSSFSFAQILYSRMKGCLKEYFLTINLQLKVVLIQIFTQFGCYYLKFGILFRFPLMWLAVFQAFPKVLTDFKSKFKSIVLLRLVPFKNFYEFLRFSPGVFFQFKQLFRLVIHFILYTGLHFQSQLESLNLKEFFKKFLPFKL